MDKASAILQSVARRPRSLSELVADTGMSRATSHRLAQALETHGLLRRNPDGRFALGPALLALGQVAATQLSLATVAAPALAALRDTTGESAQLYEPHGDHRVCTASLESPHGLRTIVPTGAVLPLDRGSAGRILSAGWSPSAGRRWEASVEEREPGVASVSAPVCDAAGNVVAAIGVSGPVGRTTRRPGRRYGDAVVAAAEAVETAAGLRA